MKKRLLLLITSLISVFAIAQQDTIVGWTFPTGTPADTLPDKGLVTNSGYFISANGETSAIEMKNGVSTYAAQATGWDNGADTKYWQIDFVAPDYSNFKIFSKQEAGGSNPGPKDWKLQYKLGESTWTDVPSGEITCANDWTTGVVDGVSLPSECNNPGSQTISIRWILTSNLDINGNDVLASGKSKIDDIIILGENSGSGIETNHNSNSINIFPNPSAGILNIDSDNQIESLCIYDLTGKVLFEAKDFDSNTQINATILENGTYILKVFFKNKLSPISKIVSVKK